SETQLHSLSDCDADNLQLNAPAGYAHYLWSTGAQGQSIFADTAGIYIVTSSNGCDIRIDSFIVAELAVRVDLGTDTTICNGHQVILTAGTNAGAGATYAWHDGSSGTSLKASASGTYRLTVSQGACSASDEINVNVEPCGCFVMMPNAFSPNGDGRNDQFGLEQMCRIGYYQLQVFNRWGQRVFLSTSPEIKWDGRFQGKLCEAGTYFFDLNYNPAGQRDIETLKGDVQLIR
ncbi:MAG: gliding motility-associated C-terminal domain-containing protein, partial [Sphingobacteriales bacterium]